LAAPIDNSAFTKIIFYFQFQDVQDYLKQAEILTIIIGAEGPYCQSDKAFLRHHHFQHNDIQHNDTKHNDSVSINGSFVTLNIF
jgi:hypothetical protein